MRQKRKLRPPLVISISACLLATLQSCSVIPQQAAAVGSSEDSSTLKLTSNLDSLVEGDSGSFYSDTGELSPMGKVTIGREYLAASGRVCKRVLNENGEELRSVICKADDERWYMRKLN